jgi:twitching motility protein PilT
METHAMARIDALFKMMQEQGASDLHLSTGSPPIFRLHGDMVRLNFKSLSHEELQAILFEILTEKQRTDFESRNDLDFAYSITGLARFRGNIFMQHKGIGAVFRIIPSKILTADDLGLPEGVRKMTHLKKGMVLVTGPTGSGKSTTLAAMIDLINSTRKEHILTLEDPLEFIHENKESLLNQRQIGEHSESFTAALRAALREDPDVILVGEMRDLETISLAMTAAETGHLVFGTLHTNSAAKTVDRIIDAFPRDGQEQIRTMLAESLKGVVCQQLLKTVEGKGRVAAMEIMVGTPAIANLIREGKTFQIPSITVSSNPGEGTEVVIYFPLVKGAGGKMEPTSSCPMKTGTETILIAEDDDDLRRLNRELFEECGYRVIEAANGQEALELYKENQGTIDLLLFDVVMPKMNGREAFEEIRTLRPDMRVLFTSGYTSDILSSSHGIGTEFDCIAKPQPPEELMAKVRDILDRPGD